MKNLAKENEIERQDESLIEYEKKKSLYKWRFFVYSYATVFAVVLTYFVFFMDQNVSFETGNYVEKKAIKQKIESVIFHGGSLDLVKHVYEVREIKRSRFFSKINLNEYYAENTPLSIILNDICVDFVTSNDSLNSNHYFQLCNIIQENQYHNPFDNLEDSQIGYFENLRDKIGDKYELVQNDVSKIAAEMCNQNQLVSKYLGKSNMSLIISLIALAITILVSLFQIIQGFRMNKKLDIIKPDNLNDEPQK